MRRNLSEDEARALLSRVLSGDREAYAEIVAGYQDPVRAALGAYARSPEEAEEFCHAAFVEAYFKLPQYRPERGPFLPWFLALARNVALEELRRRQAEGRRLHRYLERAASEPPRFEDAELARRALEVCLAQVEADDARVLRARYREGRSCDQIADALGRTSAAVRKLLQRLRERLRACVEHRLAARGEAPE